MPTSEPKQWTCSTQPDSIAGIRVGMRIEREMGADLALQSELFAVGRQQQLDRGGVEADAVIEPADAVGSRKCP